MSCEDVVIAPQALGGSVLAVASKSVAHRALMLAALCAGTTEVDCPTSSADIEATVSCVEALGARVERTGIGFAVTGIGGNGALQAVPRLDCGESGSTLRFVLPVVAALGCGARIVGHGRLADRPLSPLCDQLALHGVTIRGAGGFPLVVGGRLTGGTFVLPGDVSSQYVSGLLMAAPLTGSDVCVLVSEPVESRPYVTLTIRALTAFGATIATGRALVDGRRWERFEVAAGGLVSPGTVQVEGDWSNAAFWLAAGALSPIGVEVGNLDTTSEQGDRAILAALALFGARVTRSRASATVTKDGLRACSIDVSDTPDLVPPLCAVAAFCEGTTRLRGAGRLRLKESDRLQSVSAAINALGGSAAIEGDDLAIRGGTLSGGTVDAANDHRIAMMASICATAATGPVTVRGAGCVAKSYPRFFEDLASLGGLVTRGEVA